MAWTAFSAEAIDLKLKVLKLERDGRLSEATDAIVAALERAHRDGPSGETYEEFEARA
jgi:hypothetical protein